MMSIDLMGMFKDQFGDLLVKKGGEFLGESRDTTQSAMGAILPGILGGLVKRGETEKDAQGILDFLSDNKHDGGILDNISDLFVDDKKRDGLMETGSSTSKFLMGDKLDGLLDLVMRVSGLGRSASSSLFKMVAPLFMGFLGKYIKNKGLDAGGLVRLLSGQHQSLKAAAPSGLDGLLGLGLIGDNDVRSATYNAETVRRQMDDSTVRADMTDYRGEDHTVDEEVKSSPRILPWIILALAILALLWLWRGCSQREEAVMDTTADKPVQVADTSADTSDSTADKVDDSADKAATSTRGGGLAGSNNTSAGTASNTAQQPAKGPIVSVPLPGGSKISIPEGSYLGEFVKFIDAPDSDLSRGFIMEDLNFETGTNDLTPESLKHLDDMVAVLNAYQAVKVRLEGHTDNTGEPISNKVLSEFRADGIKSILVDKGVDDGRIEAAGFGEERPVASNDTEEGRQKNRRVEIYVSER